MFFSVPTAGEARFHLGLSERRSTHLLPLFIFLSFYIIYVRYYNSVCIHNVIHLCKYYIIYYIYTLLHIINQIIIIIIIIYTRINNLLRVRASPTHEGVLSDMSAKKINEAGKPYVKITQSRSKASKNAGYLGEPFPCRTSRTMVQNFVPGRYGDFHCEVLP